MPIGTPVQVRFSDDERDALDNYRREKPNPPSRAQAAKELIRRALKDRMEGKEVQADPCS